MAQEKEAQIFITGVDKGILSFRGTLNHGVQPSTFVVEIIPQKIDEVFVDITLKYPHPVKAVEIKGCLIDSSSFSSGGSGNVSVLYIKDYRWKWQYTTISLLANIRNSVGDIIDDPISPHKYLKTKMSVVEIAQKVCDKLGVKLDNRAILPVDYFPEIIWENYNAALALSDLFSPLGLRICPSYDGTKITVHTAGFGVQLPQDNIESLGENFDPKERPKRIRVVSAPIVKTMDFALTPVIAEPGGLFELPYDTYLKPSSGAWRDVVATGDIPQYDIQAGRKVTTQEALLVEQSAFQWFAIDHKVSPPKDLGDVLVMSKIDRVWSFEQKQIVVDSRYRLVKGLQNFICEPRVIKSASPIWRQALYTAELRRPFVWGAFWHDTESGESDSDEGLSSLNNSADSSNEAFTQLLGKLEELSYIEPDDNDGRLTDSKGTVTDNDKIRKYIVQTPFSIDFETGLVRFSDKVYLNRGSGSDTKHYFPELFIRIGFRCMNEEGFFERIEYVLDIDPNSPADEIYVEANEVVPTVHYNAADGTVDEVRKYLMDYAVAIFKSLTAPPDSQTATYVGIREIELDGAIQSVGWSIDGSGARTTVSRNQDNGDSITLGARARQRALDLAKTIRENDIFAAQQRRRRLGLSQL